MKISIRPSVLQREDYRSMCLGPDLIEAVDSIVDSEEIFSRASEKNFLIYVKEN